MDAEGLEDEVENDTERGALAGPPGEEDPAAPAAATTEEEGGESVRKTSEEEVAGDSGEPPGVHTSASDPGLSQQPKSEEGTSDGDGPPTLESTRTSVEAPDQPLHLLHSLHQQRDGASRRSSLLQAALADYFSRRARDDAQVDGEVTPGVYEEQLRSLAAVKELQTRDWERVQQQVEQLRLRHQEKLDLVEREWRAFVDLKRDTATSVLSRHLGKQAAQARVESTLASEQLQHDQLIRLRLQHIRLRTRIDRLEAELRDVEERTRDPLKLQFEQLWAEKLEQKKLAQKQSEESLKLEKKISSSLEILSNTKEKLHWTQKEVQTKREQLAVLEAAAAQRRDLLTGTKQACTLLHRDNLRLKERSGLLGNRVLLRDFENTVDASQQLEEQLENLQSRRREIALN
ncbi:cilia- and flagella-associated protein 184 [Aulostomus maculatus]